jgi:phosphoribosylglycinamide formyltransferase-1
VKQQIRIAIFISGKGTNALNLLHYFQNHVRVKIALVFSTRPNEIIEKAADDFRVNFIQFDENGCPWQELALKVCEQNKIDFIVLAGFLKKFPSPLIKNFPDRIVNIHPSLLPKFGGKGMYGLHVHQAVIAAGDKKSGITIHYVNEEFDEGEVVAQIETKLDENETSESLAEKIHTLEMKYFPKVLEELLSKSVNNY